MIGTNQIYNMDCLLGMNEIEDRSIDMILCDLPYGTTACKWDTLIPLKDFITEGKKVYTRDEYILANAAEGKPYKEYIRHFEENKQKGLWSHYERIIKDDGAIVLFGSEPFSTILRNSNLALYKYDWIWKKNTVDGFFNSRCRPLKSIENISVFSKKNARAKGDNMKYYPQGLVTINKKSKNVRKEIGDGHNYFRKSTENMEYRQKYTNYPTETLEFPRDKVKIHPTQKPVALLEYLIKTYTKPGELVMDNCFGSGSTIVAAINTGRNYIGFELDKKYFDMAEKRIAGHLPTAQP